MKGELSRKKSRPPCPFYGFKIYQNNLVDTYADQCPFQKPGPGPCRRNGYGEKPDYFKCSFALVNSLEGLSHIFGHLRVYAQEFASRYGGISPGITFREWLSFLYDAPSPHRPEKEPNEKNEKQL